jgi:hypothetical protein
MEVNTETIVQVKTQFGTFEVAEEQSISDFEREAGMGWIFRSTERLAVYAREWTQLHSCYKKYIIGGDWEGAIEASVAAHRKYLGDTQNIPSDWGDCGGGIAHWR